MEGRRIAGEEAVIETWTARGPGREIEQPV